MLVALPLFPSVTLSLSQTRFPVIASRQTSFPDCPAEKTRLLRRSGVEVLLRIRLAGALVSGQSREAAGRSWSNFKRKPVINKRSPSTVGVATTSELPQEEGSRQKGLPVSGSRLVTDWSVHTINWRTPPARIIIGELFPTFSS